MSFKQPDFWEAVQHPKALSPDTVERLEAVVEQYPYFQLLHTLIAKAKHDQQTPDAYAALGRAAIYAPDRRLLRRVFYDELTVVLPEPRPDVAEEAASAVPEEAPAEAIEVVSVETEETVEPTPVAETPPESIAETELAEQTSEEEDSDLLRDELAKTLENLRASKELEADSLPVAEPTSEEAEQTTVAPDAPRTRQQEIIDRFVAANPQINRDASPGDKSIADLSAQSTAFQEDLATENLAEIMLKQGKNDRAVHLYEKLMLKYPEKKAYFAQKIEQLKNT